MDFSGTTLVVSICLYTSKISVVVDVGLVMVLDVDVGFGDSLSEFLDKGGTGLAPGSPLYILLRGNTETESVLQTITICSSEELSQTIVNYPDHLPYAYH